MERTPRTVARLIVECLENEGVEYVFGLPGEENLHMIDAFADSSIRFITTRDERGASFMADTYGALTGTPGVCLATLGPGAINLMLGIANAQLDSHPMLAITAQAGLHRIYKESHQFVDLVSLFRPITKWGDMVTVQDAAPEMVRKAFKQATTERPGSTFLIVPEDVAELQTDAAPLRVNTPVDPAPDDNQVHRAAHVLAAAKHPVVLAGPGVARDGATEALILFAERLNLPVATTFLGKGVFPDNHPNALGTIGFMVKDYANFGLDEADVVVAVGYDLVEYSPSRWNPDGSKQIIHVHRTVAEVDADYTLAVGVQGNIGETLDAIGSSAYIHEIRGRIPPVRDLMREELERGASDPSFPMSPARIVHDIREVLNDDDIVLCDTGAVKMWMARLYPTYRPNTCLISNGLATMAFSLPGALAAKLVHPERKVLGGDGRRGVRDEHERDRDRGARACAVRGAGVGGRWLRLDRVEAGHRVRAPGRRELRESGLREAGRELRRQGLPGRVRRRAGTHAGEGPRRRRGLDRGVPGRLRRERPPHRAPRSLDRADLAGVSGPQGLEPGSR